MDNQLHTHTEPTTLIDTTIAKSRIHLPYLEGMRGLSALYVVYHHAYQDVMLRTGAAPLPHLLAKLLIIFNYGHYSVNIFIVLSGYCLMLPVITASEHKLRGGIGSYLYRRARRILPPYYAALALSYIALVPLVALESRLGTLNSGWNYVLSPKVIFSHLLLMFNLFDWGIFQNKPLWSVATEWQIYFFFPLLILLWRRIGLISVVLIAFVVGLAPHYHAHKLDSACLWYPRLFAL